MLNDNIKHFPSRLTACRALGTGLRIYKDSFISTREGKGHAQGHTAPEKLSSRLPHCASLSHKDARRGHTCGQAIGKEQPVK